MAKESYDQMTMEWRKLVVDRLDGLAREQKETKDEVVGLKLLTTQVNEIAGLRDRVRTLEDFKFKTVTVLVVIQIVLGGAWALVLKMMK